MRFVAFFAVLASVVSIPAAALAEQPAAAAASLQVRKGAVIYTSDGSRVGRVYAVRKGNDGAPLSAAVIRNQRMVYIPISSLSANEKGLVTTLTRADVIKL